MLHTHYCFLNTNIIILCVVGTMVPRAAAARAFSVVGGRCNQPSAAAFVLSMRTARNPATISPLFGRPICTSSDSTDKKLFSEVKTPGPLPNVTNVESCSSDDANQTIVITSGDNGTESDHHKDADNSFHGAIHQVEHRASEKGGIELSRLMTEEAMKILERSAERSAIERRALGRAAERMSEQMTERVGERALERAGEISAERALERATEISAERALEQVAGKSSHQAAKRVGKKATERIGERAVEIGAERAAERVGERATERIGERAAERVGERATERIGERAAERIGERASERIGERALEQSVAKGVAHPLALTIPERVALRIGRGVLIALPALGGIFALYLLKMDRARAVTERKNGSRLAFMLFGGAATTDAVDAICHFAIAYGVFHKVGHHVLTQLEEVSLGCAFVSTFFAVMGEVIAYRRRKKLSVVGKDSS